MSTLIQEQEFTIYNGTNSRMMFPGLIIPGKESRPTRDTELFKNRAIINAYLQGLIEITPDPTKFFAGDTAIPESTGGGGGPGTGDDKHYVHPQGAPSASWIINHGLGKYPSVTVLDSGGTEVEGHVAYISLNLIQITFSAAFSGQAFLN